MSHSKGAFPYPGQCMSKSRPNLTGSGKMKSSHGTTGGSKTNNMNQHVGNSVGHGCRPFKSGSYKQAGYSGGATKHAKQPKRGK